MWYLQQLHTKKPSDSFTVRDLQHLLCFRPYFCWHSQKLEDFYCERWVRNIVCRSAGLVSASQHQHLLVFPLKSCLVKRSQMHLGASPVSFKCTVTKPKPTEQQRKNSPNRASRMTTRRTNAMEIKTSTYQEWFSPEESKLEGWMEVQTEGWKDVPRKWETGQLDMFPIWTNPP